MRSTLYHTPEGVRDRYNEEIARKNTVRNRIISQMHSFGYRDIETPTVEFFDVFNKDRGSVENRDMFKLFDKEGNVLCIIDLDTIMPSFVFSDYGDFLRSAANTGAEDDPDLDHIHFNMEVFEAFTKGYLEGTKSFLLPIERENLPYAASLFPYMQAVRFLTDYINGNTYYKIKYPHHNLVRTRAQWRLFEETEKSLSDVKL